MRRNVSYDGLALEVSDFQNARPLDDVQRAMIPRPLNAPGADPTVPTVQFDVF
jgi:hypothetical protein